MADYSKDQPPAYTQGGKPAVAYSPGGYPQQAYPVQVYPAQTVIVQNTPPATNALLAWISCLFCWPIAIVAVIKANEADKYIGQGDLERARSTGLVAKKWAIAAFITGTTIAVLAGIAFGIFYWFAVHVLDPS